VSAGGAKKASTSVQIGDLVAPSICFTLSPFVAHGIL